MTTVALSTIRGRFATAVDAIAGMSISRNPYDRFGYVPNTVAHLRFAVGILSATRVDADRQKQSSGIFMQSHIGVKFAYRLRPKDQIASYDEGYNKAGDIIATLTNRTPAVYNGLQIYFDDIAHEVTDSGEYMIFVVRFLIYHYIPLT